MNRIATCVTLAILVLPLAGVAQETQTPRLVPARTHVDSVAAGQADTLTVELEAGSFVTTTVDQVTVDVRVSVGGPGGSGVGTSDALERGPERVHFDADSAGAYQLVVASVDSASGRYSVSVEAEPIATDPEARVDQLMAGFDGMDVPGGVIAVVRDGELVFSKSYGMADLTYSMPFDVDTRTNIGSTSKQFTGFALTLLAERGELSLDDDVRDYLPELPDFGSVVTLRNLLTHTTGYREFVNTLVMGGLRFDQGDYIPRDEILAIVQRQPELQNEPGAEFNYNNTGFGLATRVVERVTGRSFPRWMEENVFDPLGMRDTRIRAHPGEIIADRSRGYVPDKGEGWREVRDLGASMGAGGIYTTVEDLARWMANFTTGEVGGGEIFERMTTRNVLTTGDTTSYGFGLFIDEYRGLERVHHGGSDVAHRSMLRYFPELDAGVVALSNNARFGAGGIADQVADLFLDEEMEDPEEEPAAAEGATEAPFDPDDFDPEAFDDFAGRYALEEAPDFVLRFWREDDRFLTEATGQESTEIVPTSDSTFALQGVEASVTFHRNADGEVTSLTLHQNGDHPANRLEGAAWAPTESDLQAYVGRYFSTELQTFYEIAVGEDGLLLRHRRLDEDVELQPGHREDVFTAGGLPVAEIDFERDERGRVVGFDASNQRTRGVWFERVGEGEAMSSGG